ncbi:hypothetical protein [Streptomyces sp. NPDC091027]|uniref:hypothetical protein n=1 Tax=Streptomyces sp. NPDC091027 TaxID=3365971 RepID=UPI00382F5C1C
MALGDATAMVIQLGPKHLLTLGRDHAQGVFHPVQQRAGPSGVEDHQLSAERTGAIGVEERREVAVGRLSA